MIDDIDDPAGITCNLNRGLFRLPIGYHAPQRDYAGVDLDSGFTDATRGS